MARLVSDERPHLQWEFRALNSWADKLRGLIGTQESARPVALTRCGSIHTFGMRYPIDVAFLGERGEALRVIRGLAPGEFASCGEASCTLERPACEGEWIEEGEHLWIAAVSADALS